MPPFPNFSDLERQYQLASIKEMFQKRVLRAPEAIKRRKFGPDPIDYRAWIYEDHAIVYIDKKAAFSQVRTREREHGSPFPQLFTLSPSLVLMEMHGRGPITAHITFRSPAGVPKFRLTPDTSGSLIRVGVAFDEGFSPYKGYVLHALFYACFGTAITASNCAEFLDDSLTKYLGDSRFYIVQPE
ncbi:hypothetical protein [Methylorubrum aminovorans]